MVTDNKLLVLKTQFDFVGKRLLSKSLYGNMVGMAGSIWVSSCSYMFFVSGFVSRNIHRFQADDQWNQKRVVHFQEDDELESKRPSITDVDVFREENDKNKRETEDSGFAEKVWAANTGFYEFSSGKGMNCYMEEPKAMNFTVQEFHVQEVVDDQEKIEKKAEIFEDQEKTEGKTEEKAEVFDDQDTKGKADVLEERVTGLENFSFGNFLVGKTEIELSKMVEYPESTNFSKHDASDEAESLVQNCAVFSDSEVESVTSGKDHDGGSITYEFSVGRNVSYGLQPQTLVVIKEDNDHNVKMNMGDFLLDFQLHDSSLDDGKVVFSDQEEGSESSDDEYIEISDPQMRKFSALQEEVEEQDDELVQDHEKRPENDTQEKVFGPKAEDENEDESSMEHDDLIEQLKMEIRNGRGRRLPPILEEESLCTKMVENLKLKPLLIDEKLGYKDRISEIQKVYKSYAERMKKLDILNNQTMHAIGFLQLKDQAKSMSNPKSSALPVMKSLLPQNMWRSKAQRHPTAHDQKPKLTGDLHKDFELVYVGQACLSWEILRWQHTKAFELQQCDHAQGSTSHWYNLVATEFQLFQVLLQRFIEDDPFQGPRIQHYVKSRCVFRNLLQVPAIRDDSMKDKALAIGAEEDSIILSGMLVKIIEESMHIFWTFLRKDEQSSILKGHPETQVDRNDLELLTDLRKELQKKEKRLKEIQRITNCVVKKFQKHQDQDRLEHNMLVAQVELRLISRVLNLSKFKTEQLIWCHEKLDKINFVHRKVHMEPSFLLFPC